MSYEDMAMFFLVAFYLLEQNRQNRILRVFYFPSVDLMARNSERRIAILRYFANMYQKRHALVYHKQDNFLMYFARIT